MLDLAAGGGRHTQLLRTRGFAVTAVDRDVEALRRRFADDAGVEILALDLEDGGPWRLGQGFDGIVVTNYFHRPLFPAMVDALAAGGAVLYETFMIGNERFGRPSNPDFLLRPGRAAGGIRLRPYRGRLRAGDRRSAAPGGDPAHRRGEGEGGAAAERGYSAASDFLSAMGATKGRSWESEGTWRRASSTLAGSISATMTPTPSSASARISPQGATMSEWP